MKNQQLTRLATPSAFATVADRQVEAIISTPAIARDGATITTSGIRYSEWIGYGAPLLYNHESGRPVARAVKVWIEGDKLKMLAQFPPAGTSADSDLVYRLIKENIVNATSLGFIVSKRTPLSGGGYRFDEVDLLECSFVSVPALPSAVITARSASAGRSGRFATRAARIAAVAEAEANLSRNTRRSPTLPAPKPDHSTRLHRLVAALTLAGKLTREPPKWRQEIAADYLWRGGAQGRGSPESRRWIAKAARVLLGDEPGSA